MSPRSSLRRPGLILKAIGLAFLLLAAGAFVLLDGKGMPDGRRVSVPAIQLPRLGELESLHGLVRVVDGDTLAMGQRRIRLFGIDAPEHSQGCQIDGLRTEIGRLAADQLERLTHGQRVTCAVVDQDRYGRSVGLCVTDTIQLNRAMVRNGWARSYVQYSRAYLPAEQRARLDGLGIWRCSTLIEPWTYRHQQP